MTTLSKRSLITLSVVAVLLAFAIPVAQTFAGGGGGGGGNLFQQEQAHSQEAQTRCYPDGVCVSMWAHSGETNYWANHFSTYSAMLSFFRSAWGGGNPQYDAQGRLLGMSCSNGSYFQVLYCANGATNYPDCTLTPSPQPGGNGGGGGGGGGPNGGTSCLPSYSCDSNNNIVYISADCSTAQVASCNSWQRCVPGLNVCEARVVNFLGGKSTGDSSGGTGGIDLTGHLQASPLLVSPGATTHLYWNVSNAASCSLSDGTNTLSTELTSGTAGLVSGAIYQQTVFTLHCEAHKGATPASIDETQTVNINPSYQEK